MVFFSEANWAGKGGGAGAGERRKMRRVETRSKSRASAPHEPRTAYSACFRGPFGERLPAVFWRVFQKLHDCAARNQFDLDFCMILEFFLDMSKTKLSDVTNRPNLLRLKDQRRSSTQQW